MIIVIVPVIIIMLIDLAFQLCFKFFDGLLILDLEAGSDLLSSFLLKLALKGFDLDLVGGEDDAGLLAHPAGCLFDLCNIAKFVGNKAEVVQAQFLVRDFAPLELLGDHDLVAVDQESAGLIHTHHDVVWIDLDASPQAYFLHFSRFGGGAVTTLLLLQFVLVLAIVHDLTDRWTSIRHNLYEIQALLNGHAQSIVGFNDTYLLAICPDEADGRNSDHVVYAGALYLRAAITAETSKCDGSNS
jgi:hypothetical protein